MYIKYTLSVHVYACVSVCEREKKASEYVHQYAHTKGSWAVRILTQSCKIKLVDGPDAL